MLERVCVCEQETKLKNQFSDNFLLYEKVVCVDWREAKKNHNTDTISEFLNSLKRAPILRVSKVHCF